MCFGETLSQVCAEHPAQIVDRLALPAASSAPAQLLFFSFQLLVTRQHMAFSLVEKIKLCLAREERQRKLPFCTYELKFPACASVPEGHVVLLLSWSR